MKQYLDLAKQIISSGTHKPSGREGMPSTKSLFGRQLRFENINESFPLLTTKSVNMDMIFIELAWFLNGDTNVEFLVKNNVNIWNGDAYNFYENMCSAEDMIPKPKREFIKDLKLFSKEIGVEKYPQSELPTDYVLGDLGNQYGKTWRHFGDIELDQITKVIEGLRKNPLSRRHIVSSIDPSNDTPQDLALYWCHSMFQFNCRPINSKVRQEMLDVLELKSTDLGKSLDELCDIYNIPKYYLDCQMYQRSADYFLGVPFNIASYALLTHIISKMVNMIPGDYIHTFGDVHIYENHHDAIRTQLSRTPSEIKPQIELDEIYGKCETINEVVSHMINTINLPFPNYSDMINYHNQPPIKAPLSTGSNK